MPIWVILVKPFFVDFRLRDTSHFAVWVKMNSGGVFCTKFEHNSHRKFVFAV